MSKVSNRFFLFFFLASITIAGALSFYASSHPDGLEKVAETEGFLNTAKDSAVSGSPLADYGVSGVANERLSVGLSGLLGVLVTAAVAFGIFHISRRLGKGAKN